MLRRRMEIVIVQPGLSATKATTQQWTSSHYTGVPENHHQRTADCLVQPVKNTPRTRPPISTTEPCAALAFSLKQTQAGITASGHEKMRVCGQLAPGSQPSEFQSCGHLRSRWLAMCSLPASGVS